VEAFGTENVGATGGPLLAGGVGTGGVMIARGDEDCGCRGESWRGEGWRGDVGSCKRINGAEDEVNVSVAAARAEDSEAGKSLL